MKNSTPNFEGQPADVKLTDDQREILAIFNNMDDRGQYMFWRIGRRYADQWPRHVAPQLRLVVGGRA